MATTEEREPMEEMITIEADCTAGYLQRFADDIADGLGHTVAGGLCATVTTGRSLAVKLMADLRNAGIAAWVQ
jgi:hypothetical protein